MKLDPRARMILVGEPHPEFPVDQLIRTLGLRENVRLIGFAGIEKFVEYMGACDIILNLRYPTVSENFGIRCSARAGAGQSGDCQRCGIFLRNSRMRFV